MTIAEYISSLLMIISFVVSAFMALIALKDNKKNKQQRRAYLVIIALGILLAIVLSIFTAVPIRCIIPVSAFYFLYIQPVILTIASCSKPVEII